MKNTMLDGLTLAIAATAAGGLLSAAEMKVEPGSLCAVAVQDRSVKPGSTAGLDDLIARAMAERGLKTEPLRFDPPADVEHAARLRGCSYIVYTDIVHVKETGASRACRAFRRLVSADSTTTMRAEVDFRLFRVDEVLPVLSTSVTGKSTGPSLSPHVTSRVVEVQAEHDDAPAMTGSLRAAALSEAFKRQARMTREAVFSKPNFSGYLRAGGGSLTSNEFQSGGSAPSK